MMRIYLKHNESLECLMDWVKLFNTRLENCEKLPQGKVQFLNLFRENRDIFDIFFFVKYDRCQKCTKIQPDQKKGLKCCHCDAVLKTNETNFFVIIPVEKQIEQSIEQNWAEISKFDTSESETLKSYRDAHDGTILRNILNLYKDSDFNILSLCLNVDGANKFKSNSLSVWPIQLSQNYLPPHIRFVPQNIIVNGLFFHKSGDGNELSFHEYMMPLITELNRLSTDLISVDIGDENYKFKPIITHCAVDLPAKSKLQETKQFGGYDACTYCEIPGESVLIEKSETKPNKNQRPTMKINKQLKTKSDTKVKKPKKFVRYVEEDCTHKIRDVVETLEKMLAANNGKKPIDGIKGKIQLFIIFTLCRHPRKQLSERIFILKHEMVFSKVIIFGNLIGGKRESKWLFQLSHKN